MTLVIFIVVLFGLILIGMPVAFSLLATSVALMLYLGNFDTQIIAKNLISGADNFPLMAIPFFILAGEIMNAGGMSKRIVGFAMAIFGHVRGGLGYVAIFAGILFAGLSGSAVADTAALGAILIPMMVQAGYNRESSTGLIASAGIIAPILPPSIPLIIFGVTSGVSITSLFMAGIVPGIMMGIGLVIVWTLVVRKSKMTAIPKKSALEIVKALGSSFWALLLPVIIIVGLRGGIFTPTEAGVVAAVYALVVSVVIYREINWPDLYKVFISTAKTTSTVMFLIATAMVSAWLITVSNIPTLISDFLGPFSHNQTLLLIVIMLILLVVGTAMDITPAILILVPIFMPVVKMAGINEVYFGIIFVLTATIGLLTPPVGTVMNVAAGVGKISIEKFVKGVWPFLLVYVLIVILLILFPAIILVPLEWLL
ncbi:TRAP transporter large permease [Bacillus sp. OK048]|uniref:TRAP transporter large permease n=1 Tax=Bacillus sp. OK048 TaxID=1882761 RepID=UPI000889F411|nr:TRAP transporter large permease subunit [Bacillus sp. OK048]SDN71168.1 TRAP transporter, DctM subunit [Bacillus sp. OK048]